MSPAEPDAIRSAARAAFLARITAGATHELRNVLAIVKESAGLVGDLVAAAGPDQPPDPSKVSWALDRIRLQVARGAELSTALNRVMHGLDEPVGRVELGPAVEHAVLLARRSARRQECELAYVPAANGPAVVGNGLDLSMALVGLMEWCVERLPASSALEIRVESSEDGPAVRFAAQSSGNPAGPGSGPFTDADDPIGATGEAPGRVPGEDRPEQWAGWVGAEVRTPDPATLILRFRQGDDTDGETV